MCGRHGHGVVTRVVFLACYMHVTRTGKTGSALYQDCRRMNNGRRAIQGAALLAELATSPCACFFGFWSEDLEAATAVGGWLVLVVGLALACAVVHERLARQDEGKASTRAGGRGASMATQHVYKQAIAGKVSTTCEERDMCEILTCMYCTVCAISRTGADLTHSTTEVR